MKNLKYFAILFIVSIIAISCEKDDDIVDAVLGPASMSANVNDTAWTAITRVTKHYENTSSYLITGTSLSGELIVITIKGDAVGTYTSSTSIDSLSAKVGCVWQPDATSPTDNNFFSKSGTVEITDINTTELVISGTFSFELMNLSGTKSITGGTFSNLGYSESE